MNLTPELDVKVKFLLAATERLINLYKTRRKLNFSPEFFLDIHKIVLGYEPEHAGSFRDTRYKITTRGATFIAPAPHLIALRVSDLCLLLNNLQQFRKEYRKRIAARIPEYRLMKKTEKKMLFVLYYAARAHHIFVQIHPFPGGNGRMARLLVAIILSNEGFAKMAFPPMFNEIILERRDDYLDSLHRADQGNILHFMKFLTEVLQESYSRTTVFLGKQAVKKT